MKSIIEFYQYKEDEIAKGKKFYEAVERLNKIEMYDAVKYLLSQGVIGCRIIEKWRWTFEEAPGWSDEAASLFLAQTGSDRILEDYAMNDDEGEEPSPFIEARKIARRRLLKREPNRTYWG